MLGRGQEGPVVPHQHPHFPVTPQGTWESFSPARLWDGIRRRETQLEKEHQSVPPCPQWEYNESEHLLSPQLPPPHHETNSSR